MQRWWLLHLIVIFWVWSFGGVSSIFNADNWSVKMHGKAGWMAKFAMSTSEGL